MKVVLTGRVPAEAISMLAAEHDVVSWDSEVLIGRDELLARVSGADAIL
ncbi:MAG: D-glycerate dehydrogenase, partial [Ilumatobacteraceae bacterium]|nr:D-glycerate dehydrogenase [Ilumatobacteraceae bacterium]